MTAVRLADAVDARLFGKKAARLAAASRAGLAVPDGRVLAAPLVERAAGGSELADVAAAALEELGGALAVRSSALDEDGAASFAGLHISRLNVRSAGDLIEAIAEVWRSARSEGALAYRRRLGIAGSPAMAVILQALVDAEVAGVLFTRDLSGAELLVEASWGLGEAVVGGQVVPDRFQLDRDGRLLARTAGWKDVAIRPAPAGGVARVAVDPARAEASCLTGAELEALARLGARCEAVVGGPSDVEWALAGGDLHLLQCRPLTGLIAASAPPAAW